MGGARAIRNTGGLRRPHRSACPHNPPQLRPGLYLAPRAGQYSRRQTPPAGAAAPHPPLPPGHAPSRTARRQPAGQPFELPEFHRQLPPPGPVTGMTITPIGFPPPTQGSSAPAGQALPTLGLSRVFVLTGSSTCSASESIINSL